MSKTLTPTTYNHSEQADGSEWIVIILDNDKRIPVRERDVLIWMDQNLVAWLDQDMPLFKAETMLDNDFDGVMEKYYKQVVNK